MWLRMWRVSGVRRALAAIRRASSASWAPSSTLIAIHGGDQLGGKVSRWRSEEIGRQT